MTATVVLVHGACHGSWCWTKVVDGLRAAHVPVIAVDLPGHAEGAVEPPADLYADADYVRAILDVVAGPIVLVGHSYGGAVITDAGAGHPKVERLVYLTAVMPDSGESVATAIPPADFLAPVSTADASAMVPQADGQTMLLTGDAVADLFYHDCDPADVQFALARLSRQSIQSLNQPVRGAAWRSIPTTYVLCEQDRALPLEMQKAYATRAQDVLSIPTSHSPFFSRPGDVVEILKKLV